MEASGKPMNGRGAGGPVRRMPSPVWRSAGLMGLALLCAASSGAAHGLAGPAQSQSQSAPVSTSAEEATATSVELVSFPGGTLKVEVAGFDDPHRVAELRAWIGECVQAALTAYGRLPLPGSRVRIEPARRGDARSPVPWGQTLRRDGDVAVLLFVRPDATAAELRADWTAVHELAHLFHPFLGDEGRWLAEGLASYYQNVLRARAGLMTEDEAWRRLDAGFGRGRREDSGLPLRELARGHGHGGTMRVYWAGAAFWLEADLALRQRGGSLDEVLAQYAQCCLQGSAPVEPQTFVAQLDRIAGTDVFASRYTRFAEATAFPPQEDAYTALGLQSRMPELQFSEEPAARELRRAIMGRRPTP